MVRKGFILLALVTVFASCSETDNYDAPNGGIYGKLIDKITNEPLQTQQPNGFTIQLFEKGGSVNVPIQIPGKPDGTYENSFIFQNEYGVLPTEGAFFPMEKKVVQVGKRTEMNFEVVPFLALTNVQVTSSQGKITAKYKIARSQVGGKIIERITLVSNIPTVNNVLNTKKTATNLSAIPDADILAAEYTDEVSELTPGKTYYVRIAVRTANALGKYNYSKTFPVTIP